MTVYLIIYHSFLNSLLPLMYVLDFYDIMFFCKALKQPSAHFNILNFVQFSCTNTRSSSTNKLQYVYSSNNYSHNFYFTRLPRLWNRLPPIDFDQSLLTIKSTILFIITYGIILTNTLIQQTPVHFIFVVHVLSAMVLFTTVIFPLDIGIL